VTADKPTNLSMLSQHDTTKVGNLDQKLKLDIDKLLEKDPELNLRTQHLNYKVNNAMSEQQTNITSPKTSTKNAQKGEGQECCIF
jgi:hypothetical protein